MIKIIYQEVVIVIDIMVNAVRALYEMRGK
jgi:hypothetical protein